MTNRNWASIPSSRRTAAVAAGCAAPGRSPSIPRFVLLPARRDGNKTKRGIEGDRPGAAQPAATAAVRREDGIDAQLRFVIQAPAVRDAVGTDSTGVQGAQAEREESDAVGGRSRCAAM